MDEEEFNVDKDDLSIYLNEEMSSPIASPSDSESSNDIFTNFRNGRMEMDSSPISYPKLEDELEDEEIIESRRKNSRYSYHEPARSDDEYRSNNYSFMPINGYGYGSPPEEDRHESFIRNYSDNNRMNNYDYYSFKKPTDDEEEEEKVPSFKARPYYSPYGDNYRSFNRYSGISESSLSGPSTPEPIFGKLSRVEGGRVGLRNLGNTCYFNSTLQCLNGAIELSYRLAEDLEKGELSTGARKDKRFLQATARLFHEMWQAEGKSSSIGRSVMPSQFKSILGQVDYRFAGYRQEDSQEALAIILDRLHEELKQSSEDDFIDSPDGWDKYCKKENSIVRELFHGQLKSSLECCECKFKSETYEPFSFLNLPIPTVSESLNKNTFYQLNNEPQIQPQRTQKFNILCFNDKIYNESSSYLIVNRTFDSLQEFREFHRGAGVWIVELEGNRVSAVRTKLPSAQELSASPYEFIAYKAEIMHKNHMVTLVAAKSGEVVGFPVLIRTKLYETLTPALFIETFLKGTIRSILVNRFPERLEEFDSVVSLMFVSANEYFQVEYVKNDPLDLIHVRVIILNDKSDFNEMIFFKEVDDPNDLFEELCYDMTVKSSDDLKDEDDHDLGVLNYNQKTTLKDCFDKLFSIERLSEADEWKCEKCKKAVRAEKRLELWRLPEILILHLKRFAYGSSASFSIYGSGLSGGGGSKITKPVDFPVELELKNVLGRGSPEDATNYELFGVSQHFGSLNYGHYTAIVKHEPTGKWFLADDGSITVYEDESEWNTETLKESAYVLFYRRKK